MVLVRAPTGQLPLDWRVLLSGYFPEYAYELGSLDTSMPFAELKARSLINDKAHAADQARFLRTHPCRPAAPVPDPELARPRVWPAPEAPACTGRDRRRLPQFIGRGLPE